MSTTNEAKVVAAAMNVCDTAKRTGSPFGRTGDGGKKSNPRFCQKEGQ